MEIEGFIFDMDQTLLNCDTDVTWKAFAVRHHLAPENALAEADRFYREYCAGTMRDGDFFAFQFREFIGRTPEEMAPLCRAHFEEDVLPNVRLDALNCVRAALATGKPVALLSSTCTAISTPVAEHFGIRDQIGTRLALDAAGRCNGKVDGLYTAGEAKVTAAERFAAAHGSSLSKFGCWGDSFNDRFLLSACGFPTAVTPDDKLRALAETRRWPIVNWR